MSTSLISFSAPVDFRLAQTAPDNVADAATKAALDDIYNSMQQIFRTFVDNCGIGSQPSNLWVQLAGGYSTLLINNMNRFYAKCAEPITQGAAVNLLNVSGTLQARNANATNNTKPCRGFSNGPTAATGEIIEVILAQGIASINGLTPGNNYYLSTSDGQLAAGPAVGAGNIEQYVGFAVTSTILLFNVGYWIQH